jgi:hypothetical protein
MTLREHRRVVERAATDLIRKLRALNAAIDLELARLRIPRDDPEIDVTDIQDSDGQR